MKIEHYFGPDEVERIRAATAAAEGTTSGEVVCYVVARCDRYREIVWRLTALAALAAAVAASLVHRFVVPWGGDPFVWVLLPAIGGGGLAFLVADRAEAVKRRLIPADLLAERVHRRAEAAFLEEEVFATRDRTGILLFLALFEHRVELLADAGINAKVAQEEWRGITDALADGVRRGAAADALVEAVGACGRLLAERRVERRTDDVNELPDRPRLRDE